MTGGPGQPVCLDWRDSRHWGGTDKPCRYCGKPTPLRDSKRSPAHKVCAEKRLVEQAAEATEAYESERLQGL
ncbi:hypothetical protein ABZ883_14655 [Streptomyces sp. NPDC046977]|uniref:hypothetical protein n=1 Tax=Streptomyces sp. NPDC046977 TaxID=3154703 RepID=UPI0033F4A32C